MIAYHAWGAPAPGNDWINEGLAQAADAMCGGYSNADMTLGLTARHGWIPLNTLLTRFRAQPDLRAYLQAAAFVDYLLQRYGAAAVGRLWRLGSHPDARIGGQTLAAIEGRWREELRPRKLVPAHTLASVEATGCG